MNTSSKYKENIGFQKISLAIMMFLAIIITSMLPHFESYDSYLISIVLNGKYSTDNFLMYISPILSYFSKLVNSLVPELNVFLWVCVISTILSLFGLLYCVFFFIENSSIAFTINAFITSVFILWDIPHKNFTEVAAFLGFAGLSILSFCVFARKKCGWYVYALSLFSVFFGCLIRIQCVLLVSPFFLYIIIFEIFKNRKQLTKANMLTYLMKILPFVLMVLLLFSFSTIFFNSAKYQDSVLYNKYRATMEDYPTKDWDEVADILTKEGITKSEYEMVQRWCLADTDVITTDKLERMASVQNQSMDLSISNITKQIGEIASYCMHSKGYALQLISLLVVCILLIVRKRKAVNGLLVLVPCLIAFLILLYFKIKGRVTDGMYLAFLLGIEMDYLWIVYSLDVKVTKRIEKMFATAFSIVASLMVIYCSLHLDININHLYVFNHKFSEKSDPLSLGKGAKYIHQDHFMNYYFRENSLPTKEYMNQNISMGGWYYGHTYFNDYLKNNGVSNPMVALISQDDAYLVALDYNSVKDFLEEHYDCKIAVKKIGDCDNVPVWHFSVND